MKSLMCTLILSVFLVSCETTYKRKVRGPKGETLWHIQCDNMEGCDLQAEDVCGGPFKYRQSSWNPDHKFRNQTHHQYIVECIDRSRVY